MFGQAIGATSSLNNFMNHSIDLSEELKKDLLRLLDLDFIREFLDSRLGQYYPDFKQISDIQMEPHKKHLGASSAVFVLHYRLNYISQEQGSKILEIFVSAHSDGSRQGAYRKNKYLYEHGFGSGPLRVTRPLFYLDRSRAYFYQASRGRRLFSFFTENPQADLRPVLALVAAWLKKLHTLNPGSGSFPWPVFSIAKMIPEPPHFIADFCQQDKELGELAQKIYDQMLSLERSHSVRLKRTLIYGDNHPENVIIENLATDHLEMIDFTDVALGDPMLDLGTFLQQFDFMSHHFISRQQIDSYKAGLLESYFGRETEINVDYFSRINLYQAWTALRSAAFIFYMKEAENSLLDLLQESQRYLEMSENKQNSINLGQNARLGS